MINGIIYWYFDKKLLKHVFKEIQKRALDILSKKNMILVGEFLANDVDDKKRYAWEFHDKNFQAMVKNLRPLMRVLDFEALPHNKHLLEGLRFIQSLLRKNKSLRDVKIEDFPLETIPAHLKQYLLEKDQDSKLKIKPIKSVYTNRYEFFIYSQLEKDLASNKVYANDTTQYKNFADDIKLKKTAKEKKQTLNSLDAPRLNISGEELLDELETEFETRLSKTNKNIASGKNTHIKIKGTGDKRTWTLPYQKKSDEYNNPFYDNLGTTNLIDVILNVNEEKPLMDVFTHIKPHYSKAQNNVKGLAACLIANATGMGTYKMGEASDMTYNFLRTIEQNYIRLETLRAASDILNVHFSELPIYPYYNLDNLLHGGGDGQKHKTRLDSFGSRNSPKYFGFGKGLAPYSLGVNYTIVNSIPDKGAHQHESHFLFELIFNNSSGIEIERISTDNEGSNQIMFCLNYFYGVDYAPCYRNLPKKCKTIYGSKNPSDYPADYLIKPFKKWNRQLIIDEWENIQDIIMAIFSGEVSISVITRKLCSHELKDKTKRALWELNNILRSIYLMRYVDDPMLRRYVRAALNRVEAYHLLRKNIGETNGANFRGESDMEFAIWNESARLIANIVMYYNALLFSKLMLIKEAKGDKAAAKFMQNLSPIGSQHLNFGGRYEFNKTSKHINIEKILKIMDEIDITAPKYKKR